MVIQTLISLIHLKHTFLVLRLCFGGIPLSFYCPKIIFIVTFSSDRICRRLLKKKKTGSMNLVNRRTEVRRWNVRFGLMGVGLSVEMNDL